MTEIVTILILVGAVVLLGIFLMAFTYPSLLLRAGKFLFVKPVRAVFRAGHRQV